MLDALFQPKGVAVIGASTKELSIGNRIVRNLIEFGFQGGIYPINPKVDEVRGVKAYKSILDVPGPVDVVHLPIPAASVPPVIEDCGKKGVKFVILNGGGFAETGPTGAAIEEACVATARKYGMRIFGPNCQGIINTAPEARAYCNFTFTRPEPGAISIIALSGGVAELLHQTLFQIGAGTRMYASNGNARDVSIPEILQHYGRDEGTQAIVLYVEALRDPKAFLDAALKVGRKKPILAMKAGRTEAGSMAAASHTGGLARKDITTDLIFEKAGVLTFQDERELCEAASVFPTQPMPKGNRVGIITNTGGPSVIATDVLSGGGLVMPQLSPQSEAALKEKLLKETTIRNPLDVLATANAGHFRAALDAMMNDDNIDSVFISLVTPFFVDNEAIAREIVEVNRQQIKPIVCTLMTDKDGCAETVRIMKEGEVPCFDFPTSAAKVLVALSKYGEIARKQAGRVKIFNDVDKAQAGAVLKEAAKTAGSALPAADVYRLLSAYNIPVADWRIVSDARKAEEAAAAIGFPVAVKVDSASVVHKSDVGGVILDLATGKEVGAAVEGMSARIAAADKKFLVQKCVPRGREVIVGAKADEAGCLVMAGMGGIFAEVLNDVAFKLAPLTEGEAKEMLSSLKGSALLKGVRGQKGVDEAKLVELILRVSQMATDLPMIRELDLNPVMLFEDRAVVVDARIVI